MDEEDTVGDQENIDIIRLAVAYSSGQLISDSEHLITITPSPKLYSHLSYEIIDKLDRQLLASDQGIINI